MRKRPLSFSKLATLFVLALVVGFTSCKNKKKVSEISDPDEERMEIEEEIAEAEVEEATEEEISKSERLENYFSAIANAPSLPSANGSISEALTMFSSPDAPVLIIFYQSGGTVDYDEPTTIKKYLEYLKDTNQNMATVEEMVLDDYGKIRELVLRK